MLAVLLTGGCKYLPGSVSSGSLLSGVFSSEDIASSSESSYKLQNTYTPTVTTQVVSDESTVSGYENPENETPQNLDPDYYYKELTNTQKVIYERIGQAVTVLSDTITFIGNVSTTDIEAAFYAYKFDSPEIFYLPLSEYSIATKQTKDGKIIETEIGFEYEYTENEIKSINERLVSYVNDALSKINSSMSDFDKELTLHDYIINSTVYPTTYSSDDPDVFNIVGILNGSAVCEGYAKMIKLVFDKAGLNTILVTGSSDNGAHAWNISLIGGQYYHIDATFNDTVTGNNGQNTFDNLGNIVHMYVYFNLTTAEIEKDHTIQPFVEGFTIPTCTSTTMNYYRKTNCYFSSAGQDLTNFLKTKINEKKSGGSNTFNLNCENLSQTDLSDKLGILHSGGTVYGSSERFLVVLN